MKGRKKTGSLFALIFVILFLVSIIPMSIMSFFIYNRASKSIQNEIIGDNLFILNNMSNSILNILENCENEVLSFSDKLSGRIKQGEDEKEYIRQFIEFNNSYLYASLLNNKGIELSRVGEEYSVDHRRVINELVKNHQADYEDKIIIGDIIKIRDRTIFLNLYTKLKSDSRDRWLAIGMDLSFINKISSSYNQSKEFLWGLFTSDGTIIASSNSKGISLGDDEEMNIIFSFFNNKKGAYGGEILKEGDNIFFSAMKDINPLNWKIYFRKQLSTGKEIYSIIKEGFIWMIFGTLLLLILSSYYLAYIVVRPIKVLYSASIKVGDGDFEDIPNLVIPNNEIGDLALAFGQMMDNLKLKTEKLVSVQRDLETVNQTLETKVDARTRELKSVLEELIKKERLVTIGQMASIVSHEIRNPLAVIKNSSYLVKTKLDNLEVSDPKIEKHLDIIDSEIKQANDIISEILGFARSRDLHLTIQDMNTSLKEISASYPFPENIEVIYRISKENAKVNIDTEEIKQAIRNLIGNAVEIMSEKGGKLIISTKVKEKSVKISVADTGPGMDKETKDKIFTPFFTTKARGTGLGLAVVKKVVTRHEGQITVQSEKGKGTVFNIYLPIFKQEEKEKGDTKNGK